MRFIVIQSSTLYSVQKSGKNYLSLFLRSSWQNKTNEEHNEHIKQVAYRSIVESFCLDHSLKLVKANRKLAGKSIFQNFKIYVQHIEERVKFKGNYS